MKFLNKLYIRIMATLLILLIVPFYLMMRLTQSSYQRYIEKELSDRTISTIAKGEEDIQAAFQSMAAATNVFCMDDNFIEALKEESISYFDRTGYFDKVVQKISTTNLFQTLNMHFLLADRDGQMYFDSTMEGIDVSDDSIWRMVRQGKEQNGYLTWNLFSPIQDENQNEKFVSVSRALLEDGISGDYLATLIVCINQNEVGDILSQYRIGDQDFIYLCMASDGQIVFYLDDVQRAQPDNISKTVCEIEDQDGYEIKNINDQKYIMSYYQLYQPWGFSGEDMYVLYFTEYTPIVKTFDIFARHLNVILLVCLMVLILVVVLSSIFLTRPVIRLEKCMELYSEKQIVTGVNLNRKDEIGSLSRTFYNMEIKINDLFRQLRRETEVRERYRYQALRAQINPHFLFNTLNTVRWMAIMRKADNITEMIDALGIILRYSMEREGELIPLQEELEMIRRYVFIQNYRYGKECQLAVDVPKELLEHKIIKFILQPVVENAFIHAFRDFDGQPQIIITGFYDAEMIYIRVLDNGMGIDGHSGMREKKVTGIGLANVNERIQIEYGKAYGIRIDKAEKGGTVVEYRLPFFNQDRECDEKNTNC